jgi:hypothetical protein
VWWDVIGSAVEHAASVVVAEAKSLLADCNPNCPATAIAFKDLFLSGEADEEEMSSLATVLDVIREGWPAGVKAAEVATLAAETSSSGAAFKSALELASGKGLPIVTAVTVTWRLKAIVDAPIVVSGKTIALRYLPDVGKHGGIFRVEDVR